jgi:hypothetical protein
VFSAPVSAGAWTQPKGEGLFIVTTLLDRADQSWGADRTRIDDGYFYKDEVAFYAEYGLDEHVTLIGRMAWQNVRRRSGLDQDSASGLSASEVGARARLWQDDARTLALQATALIPGQGENVSNRPLGSGGQAAELRLLAGQAWGSDVFIDSQIAYRWRDGIDLDEARLDLTLGWRPDERWLILAQTFSVFSVQPGRPGAPDFDQHKLQMSIGREWGGVEYHLGGFITPAGRNSIEDRAVFLSTWRRF